MIGVSKLEFIIGISDGKFESISIIGVSKLESIIGVSKLESIIGVSEESVIGGSKLESIIGVSEESIIGVSKLESIIGNSEPVMGVSGNKFEGVSEITSGVSIIWIFEVGSEEVVISELFTGIGSCASFIKSVSPPYKCLNVLFNKLLVFFFLNVLLL